MDTHLKNTEFDLVTSQADARAWGWYVAGGTAFVIAGVFAYLYPVASTVSITFFLATMLLVGGAIHLLQSFFMWGTRNNVSRLLHSLVSIVAGLVMLRYPAGGIQALAIVLIFYLFISSAIQWIMAQAMIEGRFLGYLGAILSFILAFFMVLGLPYTSLWVPGLILGINFIVHGACLITMGLELRRPHTHGRQSPAHL